jgi:RNase H-fold protein (predicted Holliday junction resolvase)
VKKTNDQLQVTGPILALDLGEKLVGTAISDEMLITTKRPAAQTFKLEKTTSGHSKPGRAL